MFGFGQSARNKVHAAAEKLSEVPSNTWDKLREWAALPGQKASRTLDEKIRSKYKTGVCIGCGKRIGGGSKEYYHRKCALAAQRAVNNWASSTTINLTNECPHCHINLLTTHAWNRNDCCPTT